MKPRYMLPVHGDYKRLRLHSQLAEQVGIEPDAIFRGRNGLTLEIDERGARWGAEEQAGMIFVDGVDIGDPEDVALRDRRMLSADGIFIVVATVSEQDGRSVAEIMSLGSAILTADAVMAGVPEMIPEVQVEGTFPDGTKLVTIHDPIR